MECRLSLLTEALPVPWRESLNIVEMVQIQVCQTPDSLFLQLRTEFHCSQSSPLQNLLSKPWDKFDRNSLGREGPLQMMWTPGPSFILMRNQRPRQNRGYGDLIYSVSSLWCRCYLFFPAAAVVIPIANHNVPSLAFPCPSFDCEL